MRRLIRWLRGKRAPSLIEMAPDRCQLQVARLLAHPECVSLFLKAGPIVTIAMMTPEEARAMARELCENACMAQESLPLDSTDESDLT